MTIDLFQTAADPVNPSGAVVNTPEALQAMMNDTQGNLLASHGRNFGRYLFVQLTADAATARKWVAATSSAHVTSAWAQWQDTAAHRATGADGGLFGNVYLSAAGYRLLGLTAAMPDDASFSVGAKDPTIVAKLADPPVADWEPGFQGEIHVLVALADDDPAALDSAATALVATLKGVGNVVDTEDGAALRRQPDGTVAAGGSGQVCEHFGFNDGISDPLVFAVDIDGERLNSGGFDHYDPSAPLGLVLVKDPGGSVDGYGSYVVFRKLAQDVASFHADEAKLATALFGQADSSTPVPPADAELAAAYIVGRFRDGTPVVKQAVSGWTNEPNDFNYDADVDGVRCPFHAHIRKTNPRGDKQRQFTLPLGEDRARRIARRAISFGPPTLDPPPGAEVGLLFVCLQSSIVDQFEFLQASWSNAQFFLRPATGLDPIIGQADDASQAQQWPRSYGSFNELSFATNPPTEQSPYVGYTFGKWVTNKGGEYFFAPSIGFLTGMAS